MPDEGGGFDLAYLLRPEVLEQLELVDKLRILFIRRTPLVGSPDGWSVQVFEDLETRGPDFEAVIEQALQVMATKHLQPAEAAE